METEEVKKEVNEKVLPIGRLDFDTSGLLLLTNEKEFISLMLNPKKSFEKEYHVKVEGLLRKEESKRICKGVTLGEFKTKPCKIKNVKYLKTGDIGFIDNKGLLHYKANSAQKAM